MSKPNVLDFAQALQRRRERNASTAQFSHECSWPGRYRDGIDGLWTRNSTGEIVQLVVPRNRPTASRIDETHNG
jgi:hypothetical protein